MKQIFFKTVRKSGASVWAIGKHKTIYKVGQHYKFPAALPAHVFGLNENGTMRLNAHSEAIFPEQKIDHDRVYALRAEPDGVRVLICYGEVKLQHVPCCDIYRDWNFYLAPSHWRFTSDDFDVIGEIMPTKRVKQLPRQPDTRNKRVVNDFDSSIIQKSNL